MANTIGWGKGVQNNTIGWGKYQNTIDAGSVYADSYSGETVLIGASAAFSYSASSFHQGEADPTPTITGTTGGTFSATPSGLSINSSTGTIDLDASTIQSYTITYTVSGVSAQQSLDVTAAPFANTNSFLFDGTDERMICSTNGLGLTSAVSISAWIKVPSGSTGGGGAAIQAFLAEDNLASGQRNFTFGWRGSFANDFYFQVYHSNNSSNTELYSNVGDINDGNWHHVVATYDGTTTANAFKIYVDTVVTQKTASSTGMANNSIGTLIGATRSSSPTRFFEGHIDELAVWNTALSSTDVSTLYGSGTPSDISSLSPLHWWRMGEQATFSNPGGTGDWTLVDQGSGGKNATSVNMEESDRTTDIPS